MIGTIGDLVDDVVVRLAGPVNLAADTDAVVVRRQGGSAANTAVSVIRAGGQARFIGQVGDDATGDALVEGLRSEGVEVCGRRGGRTGTIVVLVDHVGERTMLSDRGSSGELDRPERSWLTGLSALHVPAYSLVVEPLATTVATLVEWAHDQGITVSIDASSSSVIEAFGVDALLEAMQRLRPAVLLCNEIEAAVLGDGATPTPTRDWITVVKRGSEPATVLQSGATAQDVPAEKIADVRDTTGAGDAFAAGFLIAFSGGATPVDSVVAGHHCAASAIRARSVPVTPI